MLEKYKLKFDFELFHLFAICLNLSFSLEKYKKKVFSKKVFLQIIRRHTLQKKFKQRYAPESQTEMYALRPDRHVRLTAYTLRPEKLERPTYEQMNSNQGIQCYSIFYPLPRKFCFMFVE